MKRKAVSRSSCTDNGSCYGSRMRWQQTGQQTTTTDDAAAEETTEAAEETDCSRYRRCSSRCSWRW